MSTFRLYAFLLETLGNHTRIFENCASALVVSKNFAVFVQTLLIYTRNFENSVFPPLILQKSLCKYIWFAANFEKPSAPPPAPLPPPPPPPPPATPAPPPSPPLPLPPPPPHRPCPSRLRPRTKALD